MSEDPRASASTAMYVTVTPDPAPSLGILSLAPIATEPPRATAASIAYAAGPSWLTDTELDDSAERSIG